MKQNKTAISLVYYMPRRSTDMKPQGHYVKTIHEYFKLLSSDNTVEIVAESFTAEFIDCPNLISVRNHIPVEMTHYSGSLIRQFRFLFHVARNIFSCIRKAKGKLLIFISCESTFYLLFPFIRLFLYRKKIAINIYQDRARQYPQPVIKLMTAYTYHFCDIIFSSIPHLSYSNTVFIPDFIYDPAQYPTNSKKNSRYFLCIGSIAPDEKNYAEIIQAFKTVGLELVIAGPSNRPNTLAELQAIIGNSSHIQLVGKFLTADEYRHLIINAKAVILPYKKNAYYGRSSGVLLESIYYGKPVIAPVFLLNDTHVNGLGYNSLAELTQIIKMTVFPDFDNSQILSEYHIDTVRKNIVNKVHQII